MRACVVLCCTPRTVRTGTERTRYWNCTEAKSTSTVTGSAGVCFGSSRLEKLHTRNP